MNELKLTRPEVEGWPVIGDVLVLASWFLSLSTLFIPSCSMRFPAASSVEAKALRWRGLRIRSSATASKIGRKSKIPSNLRSASRASAVCLSNSVLSSCERKNNRKIKELSCLQLCTSVWIFGYLRSLVGSTCSILLKVSARFIYNQSLFMIIWMSSCRNTWKVCSYLW